MADPEEPSRGRRPALPRSRGGRVALALAVLALAVVVLGYVIRLPYVIFSPGSASPVDDVVHIEDARTYRHRGDILFLTVSVTTGRPNVWRFLAAQLDSNQDVISESDYLGGRSRSEDERVNEQLMEDSQSVAKKVALERLGYRVPMHSDGVVVVKVLDDGPAKNRLRAGDVITAIDGRTVTISTDIGSIVRAQPVGTTFRFSVTRDGAAITVPITTVRGTSGALEGRPYLGIVPGTKNLRFDFPVDVKFDTGNVSGPSAGLAFTLTILDEMAPGDLTGRRKVAVTGTIDLDGEVGPVGGVRQKAVAARRAGATLFLVPPEEARDARAAAGGDMKIVSVRSLDEALRALRANGGAPLTKVAPQEARPAA